jgi:transposase
VIKLGEVVMILDLHRQGLSVSAIALQLGIDRKTVRKYLARGLEVPVYAPRQPRPRRIDPFVSYLRERVEAWPGLTGRRLFRELKERGYRGGYTAVTDALRDLRPPAAPPFEVRFETPPGDQAQVDFAQFQVAFADEPGVTGSRFQKQALVRTVALSSNLRATAGISARHLLQCLLWQAVRMDSALRPHSRREDREHQWPCNQHELEAGADAGGPEQGFRGFEPLSATSADQKNIVILILYQTDVVD